MLTTCEVKYINMRDNYINIRIIHVSMQHTVIMLHIVNINRLHVNIIMMHVNITKSPVDMIYLASRGETYANIVCYHSNRFYTLIEFCQYWGSYTHKAYRKFIFLNCNFRC